MHDVPPLSHLTDVLRRVADGWGLNRLEELPPDPWQLLYNDGGNSLPPAEDRPESTTASL